MLVSYQSYSVSTQALGSNYITWRYYFPSRSWSATSRVGELYPAIASPAIGLALVTPQHIYNAVHRGIILPQWTRCRSMAVPDWWAV